MGKEVVVKPTVSFSFPLTTLFIVLKATGTVDWPWLWVLAPTWIPLAIVFAIIAVVFFFALIVAVLK